ncbi:MAG TPA: rod shape-determining protein RodA, partial [Stellaceae bacterium]|nr:rod shape-determining protein RodA [Stellaceae bacterium]
MAGLTSDLGHELSFLDKLCSLSWGLVLLVLIAASCGVAVLYSAADGDMQPWAAAQMVRFGIALVPMIGAALLGIRYWFR